MFGLGPLGVALGVTLLGANEIERKIVQRRNDPQTFALTPLTWSIAGLLGLVAVAYFKRQQETTVDGLVCKRFRDDLYRCRRS